MYPSGPETITEILVSEIGQQPGFTRAFRRVEVRFRELARESYQLLYRPKKDSRVFFWRHRRTHALRVCIKSYINDLEDSERIKSKRIFGHIVCNHKSLDDYKQCLFEDKDVDNGDGVSERAVAGARAVVGAIHDDERPTTSLSYIWYR